MDYPLNFSNSLLLAYRNVTGFCILILHPEILLNSLLVPTELDLINVFPSCIVWYPLYRCFSLCPRVGESVLGPLVNIPPYYWLLPQGRGFYGYYVFIFPTCFPGVPSMCSSCSISAQVFFKRTALYGGIDPMCL